MLTTIVIRRFYCPATRWNRVVFFFLIFRATGQAVYARANIPFRFRVIYLSIRVNVRAISRYAVTTILKCMINTGVVNCVIKWTVSLRCLCATCFRISLGSWVYLRIHYPISLPLACLVINAARTSRINDWTVLQRVKCIILRFYSIGV